VRDVAGKPFKVAKVLKETGPEVVGHELYYRCGRDCLTVYAVSNATGKLADYNTQSPEFVTERGSRVGMPARQAAAREGQKVVGGCAEGHFIQLRNDDRHIFVLGVFEGRVPSIVYLGPHTLSYEGLC
jgi:hypothetical protein